MHDLIHIGTWENQVRTSHDHPAPQRLRTDIDATIELAAEALADGFDAGACGFERDEVILIRRLQIDCDIDARADRRQAARALARRCTAALVRAVHLDSAEVLRFRSRGELVARFIEDLASGNAWEQWFYESFAGTRALPPGVAIRTVLLEDPLACRQALAAIHAESWPAIALALGDDDAARILEELTADAPLEASIRPEDWLAALETPAVANLCAPPRANALALLALTVGATDTITRGDVLNALLLGAALLLARLGSDVGVCTALTGDLTRLAMFEPDLAEEIAAGFAGPHARAMRRLGGRAATVLAHDAIADGADAAAPELRAPFAGLALLLEETDQLLDTGLSALLPAVEGEPTRELAALLVLALAAGGERARLVWHDAAWRAFFGITPELKWESYAEAVCDADIERARQAQQALIVAAAKHQRGERVDTAFRVHGERWHCAADDAGGLWLALGQDPARAGDALPFGDRLRAARRARNDWRALEDPALCPALPLEWRAVFMTGAQIAWRRIAQRVPGMRGSTLRYLRENLLGQGDSAKALAPEHWRWTLRRPPLHALLNITGIARSAQVWRGPPERRITWDFKS